MLSLDACHRWKPAQGHTNYLKGRKGWLRIILSCIDSIDASETDPELALWDLQELCMSAILHGTGELKINQYDCTTAVAEGIIVYKEYTEYVSICLDNEGAGTHNPATEYCVPLDKSSRSRWESRCFNSIGDTLVDARFCMMYMDVHEYHGCRMVRFQITEGKDGTA